MKITVIEPQTPEEFKQYYSLRYKILRKPWGQPRGSERDNEDEISHHRMIIDEATGDAIAVGRLQFNTREESQIRYMAVADNYQGQGLGSKIVTVLEILLWTKELAGLFCKHSQMRYSFTRVTDMKSWKRPIYFLMKSSIG